MILLTMRCSRCNKEVSHDMTNNTLSNELISKFGFCNAHDGRNNVLICKSCEKSYKELQDRLEISMKKELCDFFKNCGKDKENGDKGKPENG